MKQIKKSLYELMNEELQNFHLDPYTSLDNFINHDDTSAGFIRTMLNDEDFVLPDKGTEIFGFSKARVRHSAVTFLMGLVFLKIFKTSSAINRINNDLTNIAAQSSLWLITSLYHDVAYFSKRISNGDLDYRKAFKYFLLTDHYNEPDLELLHNYSSTHKEMLAHTYDQIICYDTYARGFHARLNDSAERIDHGILGGVMTFNTLVGKALKHVNFLSYTDLTTIKSCCLTIAQHNIFKSDSPERDKDYPIQLKYLYHDSDFRIDSGTPLLLLLCLIDTLECVKRFSKSEQENSNLQTKTVLSSMLLTFDENSVVLDCAPLHKRVKDKKDDKLEEAYKQYRSSILSFHTWTTLHVEATNDNVDEFIITLAEDAVSRNLNNRKLAG